MSFVDLNAITKKTRLLCMQNQPNGFDTSIIMSRFLEIQMCEDDKILLPCLRDTLCNEVVNYLFVFHA